MPSNLNTYELNKLKTPKFDQKIFQLNKTTLSDKSRLSDSFKMSDEPQLTSGKVRDFGGKN